MNISEFTSEMMQNLGQRWYDAVKDDIKTPQLMKLCYDTDKAVTFLENSSVDIQDNSEKIAGLCHAAAGGFAKLGSAELESVAKWVGHHSEAYQALHHLLEVLKAKNDLVNFYPAQDNSLSNLALIDSRSLSYITEVCEVDKESNETYLEANKKSLNIPDEIMLAMCDNMSGKDLLKMRTICRQNLEIANRVLINRLNTGQISFSNLNIVNENDLIGFFGESACEILFIENNADTETSPPILCFAQLNTTELLYVWENADQLFDLDKTINEKKAIVNIVLINRLNSGEISFSDLKIVTEKDLKAFFGENASKIHYETDLYENADISNAAETSPSILCYAQMNADELLYLREISEQKKAIVNTVLINRLNSGGISFKDLNIVTENDLNALLGERSSEVVRLEIKAPEELVGSDTSPPILCVAQLATIKELKLPFLYIDSRPPQDISVLKHCSQLKTLIMSSFYANYDISVLSHCPKLKYLDISDTIISDISVLSHCSKLKIVFINGTKVTDVSVLKKLRKSYNVLEKVQMMHCAIPKEDLQELEDLGVELVA